MDPKKRPKRLSNTFLKTVRVTGRFGDGRGGYGLSALVTKMKNGRFSVSFCQRYRLKGKLRDRGRGRYPLVSLDEARDEARKKARMAAKGIDPDLKRADLPLFKDVFEEYLKTRIEDASDRLADRTVENYRSYMKLYIFPYIGNSPMDKIKPVHVIDALRPNWKAKYTSLNSALVIVRDTFDWYITETRHIKKNPVNKRVRKTLKPQKRQKNLRKAAPYTKMPSILLNLRSLDDVWPETKFALEFLFITVGRSEEIREAAVDQIDLETLTWYVPGPQMKMKLPHRVPLPRQAIPFFEQVRAIKRENSDLLFPGQKGEALAQGTLLRVFKSISGGATPHGCRRTFTNCITSLGVPKDVADACLAHTTKGGMAHYLTADMFVRRRKAMQAWADFLYGELPPDWTWVEPSVEEVIRQKELDVEMGYDYDAL